MLVTAALCLLHSQCAKYAATLNTTGAQLHAHSTPSTTFILKRCPATTRCADYSSSDSDLDSKLHMQLQTSTMCWCTFCHTSGGEPGNACRTRTTQPGMQCQNMCTLPMRDEQLVLLSHLPLRNALCARAVLLAASPRCTCQTPWV